MTGFQQAARAFMVYGSYYVFLLLFTVLAYRYFLIRGRIAGFFKTDLRGALICVALTVVVFASVAPELRVTGDENDLLGVANAMSMSSVKRADRAMNLQGIAGDLTAGSWGMDFRPLAFPFAEQIAYVFSGDLSEKKAFALNAVFLFVFLWVLYRAFEKRLGWAWAFSALLAVLAQPVLTLSAASAGYDMAALLFLALSLVFMREFLEAPDRGRFGLLWVHLLVLANLRHEGIALFAVAVFWLLWWKRDTASYLRSEPLVWATPLILAPLFCQRLLVPFWGQQPGKTALDFFSLRPVLSNIGTFIFEVSKADFWHPFAGFWNVLGAAAVIYFGIVLIRRSSRWDEAGRRFACVAVSWAAILFVLINAYGSENFRYPVTARYYLPLSVFFSISAVALLSEVRFMNAARISALALGVFVIYHPVAAEGGFSHTYLFNREYYFVESFLKRQPDRQTCLLVTSMPQQYGAGWSIASVSPWYVNAHKEEFLGNDRRFYSRMFAVQRIDRTTGDFIRDAALEKDFRLETLDELPLGDGSLFRISEVLRPGF
jgi:hypothetical protein